MSFCPAGCPFIAVQCKQQHRHKRSRKRFKISLLYFNMQKGECCSLGVEPAFWHIFIFIYIYIFIPPLTIISPLIVEILDFRAQSAQLRTQPAGWLPHQETSKGLFSGDSTPALMIMILFRNYPLSFTAWKRAICAAVVLENGIISVLIMMTYDFHCQICSLCSHR